MQENCIFVKKKSQKHLKNSANIMLSVSLFTLVYAMTTEASFKMYYLENVEKVCLSFYIILQYIIHIHCLEYGAMWEYCLS